MISATSLRSGTKTSGPSAAPDDGIDAEVARGNEERRQRPDDLDAIPGRPDLLLGFAQGGQDGVLSGLELSAREAYFVLVVEHVRRPADKDDVGRLVPANRGGA